jgi:hypothetical protein
MIYLALVSHAATSMVIEKRQKVSSAILALSIKHSMQLYAGVWISKSPDHNIIVIDTEGFSRTEVEQVKVY